MFDGAVDILNFLGINNNRDFTGIKIYMIINYILILIIDLNLLYIKFDKQAFIAFHNLFLDIFKVDERIFWAKNYIIKC